MLTFYGKSGIALLLASVLALTGCVTTQGPPSNQAIPASGPAPSPVAADPSEWTWDKITVSLVKATGDGEYNYALTRKNGRWTIVSDDEAKAAFTNESASFERISFDSRSMRLTIRFSAICQKGQYRSDTQCSCARGLISENTRTKGYTLCSSEFKAVDAGPLTAVTGVVGAFLTLGTSTSLVYQLDAGKVIDAAKEARLLDAIKNDRHERYVDEFRRAQRSVMTMTAFIEKAKATHYDPDALSAAGEQMIPTLRQQEEEAARKKEIAVYRQNFEAAKSSAQLLDFISRHATSDPDNLVPQARKKLPGVKAAEQKAEAQAAVERHRRDLAMKAAAAREEKERKAEAVRAAKAEKLANGPISPNGSCRPRSSRISCSSECYNGNCVVTYENGCRIRVQVRAEYDPFSSSWNYPSPGC